MAGRPRLGSPGGRSLPILRDDYRSFSPEETYGRTSRFDNIEDRLAITERNTNQLMEKANKIKEDLLDNLNMTQGTWQEEKVNRELMQEHIRTITDLVRKLSRDINQIEHQITARGTLNDSASAAVKNLEVSHVAGITDLRGRVGRCDAAIAKLAGDLKNCFETVKTINVQNEERSHRLDKRLYQFENKLNEVGMKIDRMMTDQQLRLRHIEGDSSGKISSLDAKTRQQIDETRNVITTFKSMEENEREKLEARLVHHTERLNGARDVRMEKIEQRLNEGLHVVSKRVTKQEEDLSKEKIRIEEMKTGLEAKVNTSLDANHKRQMGEISRLKKECREGFATLHESIGHMRQVTDGRRKLLEEQIRKEIAQIRKMVVLI